MNELINILILISCVLIWIDTDIFINFRFKKWKVLKYKNLNRKPFNCSFCLTFWGAVVLCFVMFNPVYMIAPLLLRLIEKRI
jgi:hypothetical protein